MKEAERPEPKETAFLNLMKKHTVTDWRVAESSRSLRYNGQSKRKKQYDAKKARDRNTADEKVRNSSVTWSKLMLTFVLQIPRSSAAFFQAHFLPSNSTKPTPAPNIDVDDAVNQSGPNLDKVLFGGYKSDFPEDDPLELPSDDELGVEGVYEDDQQANSEAEDGGEEKLLRTKLEGSV
ncbi:hypothetical protein SERLA73DRAFT_156429 [Serpula lacrymans var. lacrymans S7.3]|uniref:Uncharacterized protein n=2 Tax=Serpula lacrymans var. lacrymans TaxID=341189 RepID=F8QEF6_SERL3|nr:hypothetical protein SERLA73DRAFT_156429 [Serpula lacrymans var. lacrymans S7.3]